MGALRSTQNGVLGRGGGARLETSRASSGTTMGGCNCVRMVELEASGPNFCRVARESNPVHQTIKAATKCIR